MDNNEEEIDVSNQNEEDEIEFDDNIDIDAIQNQLMAHMANSDIQYEPEPEKEKKVEEEPSEEETQSNLQMKDSDIKFNPDLEKGQQLVEGEEYTLEALTCQNIQETESAHISRRKEKLERKAGERKYIIYIEKDNIDFIENLSVSDRKKTINRILREEDGRIRKRKEMLDRIRYTNQVIVMVLTVVIFLPLFFIILNKSVEATIINYQQSQQNFVKLYREQGKIKSYKSFQKTFQ